jgi:tetratricopeptide (TPR) repeat protein
MEPDEITVEQAAAALDQNNFQRAEAILRELNRDPARRSLQSLLMFPHALELQDKIEAACLAYEVALQAVTEPPQKVWILNRLGDCLYSKKHLDAQSIPKAAAYLERSVEIEPGLANATSRMNLCILYMELREFQAVVGHAKILQEFGEFRVEANLYLADAFFYLNQKASGKNCLEILLRGSVELDDGQISRFLSLLIKYRCFSQAQAVIDDTVSRRGDSFSLKRFQAQAFFDAKDYESVLPILTEEFINSSSDSAIQRLLYFFRGRALDAIGDYPAAHQSFVAMNRLASDAYSVSTPADVAPRYGGVALGNLPKYDTGHVLPYTPVFMIGFPRSGTTLLDTILDTQKGIRTLSEVDGMAIARQCMQNLGKAYPDDLENLTEPEVRQIRDAYFRHNDHYLSEGGEFSVLIDKMPLNILHVPLIVTLFPNARFILSLRHSIDVCLSCFQQDFVLTDEMAHFSSLERCFQRYRDVMNLFERYRNELSLNIHTLRYEDLVDDLDGTAAKVFQFLNYQGDEKYRDFYLINREKLLRTPSRDQVIEPIYKSSRQRWKNYAEFVEPYIPLVQPFLEKYGYAD